MVCVMGFVDSRAPNRVRAKLRKTVGDTSPTVLKLGTSSLQETVLTDHLSVRLKWFEPIVSFWLRVIAISVYTRQVLSIAMSWKIHHRQIYCIFRRFGGVRVVTITGFCLHVVSFLFLRGSMQNFTGFPPNYRISHFIQTFNCNGLVGVWLFGDVITDGFAAPSALRARF